MSHVAVRAVIIGSTLIVSSLASLAQTTDTPKSSPPTPVGVTPQAANSANQQAVPRSDTATVVRTGPTAAQRMKDTASGVWAGTAPATGTTSSPAPSGTSPNTPLDPAMRPARPDRN